MLIIKLLNIFVVVNHGIIISSGSSNKGNCYSCCSGISKNNKSCNNSKNNYSCCSRRGSSRCRICGIVEVVVVVVVLVVEMIILAVKV